MYTALSIILLSVILVNGAIAQGGLEQGNEIEGKTPAERTFQEAYDALPKPVFGVDDQVRLDAIEAIRQEFADKLDAPDSLSMLRRTASMCLHRIAGPR